MARQRFEPGVILRIDVDGPRHAYARMLSTHPYVAVYEGLTDADLTPEEVVQRPVLFVLAVFDGVYKTGRWPKVGAVPVEVAPVGIPEFFRQDMFNPSDCTIVDHLGNSRPATPLECAGLERSAVWDAEHVEQRLRDQDADRPNAYLEHMKLKV
jgi:hypothetical protein